VAHEIDQTTGRAAVFVTGEPAWHRLGTVIEQATTSAEAIGLAGLDWRVEQWPVRAFDPDNNTTEAGIPDTVANVRTDTKAVLGVVGRRYRVFQNHEAFDFMDGLVGDKLAMYETAGSLHGGKRVWMSRSKRRRSRHRLPDGSPTSKSKKPDRAYLIRLFCWLNSHWLSFHMVNVAQDWRSLVTIFPHLWSKSSASSRVRFLSG
jgi:hypothetical protein